MTLKTNRRTVVRGVAWAAPVVAVAVSVPAFAASAQIDCGPTAECKLPGQGSNTKDYTIRTNCSATSSTIVKVEVYDNVQDTWIVARAEADGTFTAFEFNDSRSKRLVRLTDVNGVQKVYTVPFPPC